MDINKDIFECAANSLSLSELKLELSEYEIEYDAKSKKYEIIAIMLCMIDKGEMSENLYLAIKSKAFLDNSECNEGFYYEYPDLNIKFIYDTFIKCLSEKMESEKKSHRGTNEFRYNILNIDHNEKESIVKFTLRRETKNKKYDNVDDEVKIFNGMIKATVEINYSSSHIYIQSKNFNNSTAIKYFLEKVINDLRVNKKVQKVKLRVPKFDGQAATRWANENNIDMKGISSMSIQMLDLLNEFDCEENNFTGYAMRKIYFKDEIIHNLDENRVKGSVFYGDDIKECIEIFEGFLKGKKIEGFEILADYQYSDEGLGVEKVIEVPITILQEGNSAIRVAISKDSYIDSDILSDIYINIKKVFIKKLNSKGINNTKNIISFINKAKEINKKENSISKNKKVPMRI